MGGWQSGPGPCEGGLPPQAPARRVLEVGGSWRWAARGGLSCPHLGRFSSRLSSAGPAEAVPKPCAKRLRQELAGHPPMVLKAPSWSAAGGFSSSALAPSCPFQEVAQAPGSLSNRLALELSHGEHQTLCRSQVLYMHLLLLIAIYYQTNFIYILVF